MRILVNTLSLAPATGIDVHVWQVSRELAARGHIVDVSAQRDGAWHEEFEACTHSVSIYGDFLHAPISLPQLRRPAALAKWLLSFAQAVRGSRSRQPHVIYANDQQSLMWACAVAQRPRIPIVCHLHAHFGSWPLGHQRVMLARRVDTFIAPSASVRDSWTTAGLSPDRIVVIPQAVDPTAYPPATAASRRAVRAALGLDDDVFVALYLGRVVPGKGVDTLINAWRTLGLSPDVGQLLVVGSAYPATYLRELSASAPRDSCRFFPLQADIVPLLHAADVTVVPSVYDEACPRVVIEAMATGCPVVASDSGGIPELLTGRFTTLLHQRGNSVQLAESLKRLLNWRQTQPSLADACVAHVKASYTLSAAVDGIESVLKVATTRRWRDK